MILASGNLELDIAMLLCVLDKSLPENMLDFPSTNGMVESELVTFLSVDQDGPDFEVSGEILWEGADHPILITGSITQNSGMTRAKYRIETKIDADPDEEGEEWKRNL
jgi:hypothetical protein